MRQLNHPPTTATTTMSKVLSAVVFGVVLLGVLAGCGTDSDDLAFKDVEAGDCFSFTGTSVIVGPATRQDCEGPHRAQAIAIMDMPRSEGQFSIPLPVEAMTNCTEEVERQVGTTTLPGGARVEYIQPGGIGASKMICLVRANADTLNGSLLPSAG
jgi:hypothetical protein